MDFAHNLNNSNRFRFLFKKKFRMKKGVKLEMKTIFLKDDRLREILKYRNEEINKLISKGTLKGTCFTKLSTRESKDGIISYGWEITDLENGYKIEKRFGEKEGKTEPSGTMIDQRDWFKPLENIGVFPKGI